MQKLFLTVGLFFGSLNFLEAHYYFSKHWNPSTIDEAKTYITENNVNAAVNNGDLSSMSRIYYCCKFLNSRQENWSLKDIDFSSIRNNLIETNACIKRQQYSNFYNLCMMYGTTFLLSCGFTIVHCMRPSSSFFWSGVAVAGCSVLNLFMVRREYKRPTHNEEMIRYLNKLSGFVVQHEAQRISSALQVASYVNGELVSIKETNTTSSVDITSQVVSNTGTNKLNHKEGKDEIPVQ